MSSTNPPAHVARRGFQLGTRLQRYVVGKRIGAGGMAEVYLAGAPGLGGFEKLFAIKVIHHHMVDDPRHGRMLLKEARVAATLSHPNIVQVVDVGTHEGEHYLAMEYIHGADLRRIMQRLGPRTAMPMAHALAAVVDTASALHYAHSRRDNAGEPMRIVHRDVSLSNVIIGYTGSVKLTDFGIAKSSAHTNSTTAGTIKGKFGYMSPEQSAGEPVDSRSDVFSLGVVLYELTTGRRAFVGENVFATLNRVLAGDYVPPTDAVPGYPQELARIIARSLAVDPDERYQSARDLGAELLDFTRTSGLKLDHTALGEFVGELFGWPPLPSCPTAGTGLPVAETETPTVQIAPTPRRPQWIYAGVVAAVTVAGGVGVAAGTQLGARDDDPSAREQQEEPPQPAAGSAADDPGLPPPDPVRHSSPLVDQPSFAEPAESDTPAVSNRPQAAAPAPDDTPRRKPKRRRGARKKPAKPKIDLRPPSMKGGAG